MKAKAPPDAAFWGSELASGAVNANAAAIIAVDTNYPVLRLDITENSGEVDVWVTLRDTMNN